MLSAFNPVLAGTLPLDLFTDQSDFDILCFSTNPPELQAGWNKQLGMFEDFLVQTKNINGSECVLANFKFGGFKFELFGQSDPTRLQSAYIHMVNEFKLLRRYGKPLRDKVLELKQKGVKTEPAFAKALNLPGDPYQTLLTYPS
jgi:hypothetical protein